MIIIPILIAVAVWIGWNAVHVVLHVRSGQQLRARAKRFEQSAPLSQTRILLAGDSVVFGVGASDAAHSIAGLFGQDFPTADITNLGVSGAETNGLVDQLKSVQGQQFSFVVIIIGANDVVHFADLSTSARQLETALGLAKQLSQNVVLMPEGNIANAPIFPRFASLLLTPRSRQFRTSAMAAAHRQNVTYIDVFRERADDPWRAQPQVYYAADAFHPADAGYADWYRAIRAGL